MIIQVLHQKAAKLLKGGTKPGWFWRIIAENGQTLAHSEMYTRKASAVHAAKLVRECKIVVYDRQAKQQKIYR